MITFSNETNELFTALNKAQKILKDAKLDSVNPHFKSKYASLSAVREATNSVLSDNGLSVMQIPSSESPGNVSVTTILGHTSGQWIKGTLTLPLDKPTAQGMGSAITYGRRYSLAALVNISADEDDDGNVAESYGHQKAPARQEARPAPRAQAPQRAAPPSNVSGDPGQYVFTFGKYKGKTLNTMSDLDLIGWSDYFEGKDLKGPMLEAMGAVKAYLSQLRKEVIPNEEQHSMEPGLDEIPF